MVEGFGSYLSHMHGYSYVTGFVKGVLPHISKLSTLTIHYFSMEKAVINLQFSISNLNK